MEQKSFTPLEKNNDEAGTKNNFHSLFRKKSLTGFTLIELVVVVIIIVILASLALPKLSMTIEKSRQSEAIPILVRMYQGYKMLQIEEKATAGANWSDLGFNIDPNIESEYFGYSYYPSKLLGIAMRKGDATRWITINLTSGIIEKSILYGGSKTDPF